MHIRSADGGPAAKRGSSVIALQRVARKRIDLAVRDPLLAVKDPGDELERDAITTELRRARRLLGGPARTRARSSSIADSILSTVSVVVTDAVHRD